MRGLFAKFMSTAKSSPKLLAQFNLYGALNYNEVIKDHC